MKTHTAEPLNHVVKLFLLVEDNNWAEAGQGLLHIQKLWNSKTELEEDFIEIIRSESNENSEVSQEKLEILKKNVPKELRDAYLLRSAVKKENFYDKETNRVISWADRDLNEEIAVSFIDISACNETWRLICNAIGKNPHQEQIVERKDLETLILPKIDNLDAVIAEVFV